MTRTIAIVVAVLTVVGIVGAGAAFVVRKHDQDVAAARQARIAAAQAAAQARATEEYRRLADIQSRSDSALNELNELESEYDSQYNEGAKASQKRHDLVDSQPYDVADGLGYITQEKSDVESLQSVTAQKAESARSAAAAFAEAYGDSSTSAIINDVSVAAESEATGLSDWERAAQAIFDSFSARANGRYYYENEDIGGLYRSSDDEAARSRERWATVNARLETLRNRLDRDVREARSKSGGDSDAGLRRSPSPPAFAIPTPPAISI